MQKIDDQNELDIRKRRNKNRFNLWKNSEENGMITDNKAKKKLFYS